MSIKLNMIALAFREANKTEAKKTSRDRNHGIWIIPSIRHGLALGRRGAIQFCYHLEVG